MKVFLMYRDRDFNPADPLPVNAGTLVQDLELNTLFQAMARDDKFILDVVGRGVLLSLTDTDSIVYRQRVLGDCLVHPAAIRRLYELASGAVLKEKQEWRAMSTSPESILSRSIRVLQMFLGALTQLRDVSAECEGQFRSEGFTRFFAMVREELDAKYLAVVGEHLRRLEFKNGTLISAGLGKGLKGADYTLRRPPAEERHAWLQRFLGEKSASYSFEVADRDEAGHHALRQLRERGINGVADAAARSADHILSFFMSLRTELAFYIGCLNLHDKLSGQNEPLCTPVPLPLDALSLSARGLYDACLALRLAGSVVGNDVDAEKKSLIVITGANQGGKSTFLRSIGLAQLMMQCGMFVAAEQFQSNVSMGVFTHYKREEDASMESGKFDEELKRMSEIADKIKPYCTIFLNESFSSTNEREGSEIGRQVINALLEAKIKVLLVTHMYDLAEGFRDRRTDHMLFLIAQRMADGSRTFKIIEGDPLPTSYGPDLYKQVFT